MWWILYRQEVRFGRLGSYPLSTCTILLYIEGNLKIAFFCMEVMVLQHGLVNASGVSVW